MVHLTGRSSVMQKASIYGKVPCNMVMGQAVIMVYLVPLRMVKILGIMRLREGHLQCGWPPYMENCHAHSTVMHGIFECIGGWGDHCDAL